VLARDARRPAEDDRAEAGRLAADRHPVQVRGGTGGVAPHPV